MKVLVFCFTFSYLFVENFKSILPPRCLWILHQTNQITTDFQAYLEFVETRLYHATQPDPRNVTENMLIALLAVSVQPSDNWPDTFRHFQMHF